MANFDRKSLRKIFEEAEIEVPKDVLGQICTLHTTANEDLNEDVKTLKADLEKAERERDTYKAKVPKEGEENPFEKKYNDIKKEFEDFKADTVAKETTAKKSHAIREWYKNAVGISEKRLDSVMKVTNLDNYELDENGAIKDVDKHTETAKTEWADFVETKTVVNTRTPNPPASNGEPNKNVSRASQLANEYHTNLYGKVKEN